MQDVFCDIFNSNTEAFLGETEHFVIFDEPRPVSKGHCLIVTKIHRQDAFEVTAEEWADFGKAINLAKSLVSNHNPDGYNIGTNCGEYAGQSQFHFHVHLIPRYKGDVANPRGGIRNLMGNAVAPKE